MRRHFSSALGYPATVSRVFPRYRRTDSQSHAQALSAALTAHFGQGSVFMDLRTIPPARISG